MAIVRDLSGNAPFPEDRRVFGNLSTTANRQVAVTPSDSIDVDFGACRGLYITTGGDVAILDYQGNAVTYSGVPDDTTLDVKARRVKSTGTTATGIKALY